MDVAEVTGMFHLTKSNGVWYQMEPILSMTSFGASA